MSRRHLDKIDEAKSRSEPKNSNSSLADCWKLRIFCYCTMVSDKIRSYRDWRRHMLIDQRGLSFLGLDHHEPSPPLSTLAI
ncbi:hypothetical protein DTO164E3_5943 [Paecilomyces variotii]|nr:hypothetical protein DTO164E3_5943 [Paecilomyces variotii]KAJ9351949.1 hypothetical protein DTO027B9_6080 [Paecilomyces variotii]KAJ9363061.1 hypothetical protein DTO280E4_3096 [Paecilomyces variotii]